MSASKRVDSCSNVQSGSVVQGACGCTRDCVGGKVACRQHELLVGAPSYTHAHQNDRAIATSSQACAPILHPTCSALSSRQLNRLLASGCSTSALGPAA